MKCLDFVKKVTNINSYLSLYFLQYLFFLREYHNTHSKATARQSERIQDWSCNGTAPIHTLSSVEIESFANNTGD